MNKPVRINPTQARPVANESLPAKFSASEFLRMTESGAFDDMKIELIDGELFRRSPPQTTHGRYQLELLVRLRKVLDQGLVLAEIGAALSDDTVVGCDGAVLRRPIDENRLLRPDDLLLAIEVAVTTLEKDLGIKRLAYASAAVPYYLGGRLRGVPRAYVQRS